MTERAALLTALLRRIGNWLVRLLPGHRGSHVIVLHDEGCRFWRTRGEYCNCEPELGQEGGGG